MRLERPFFERDVLNVAPELLGSFLVLSRGNDAVMKFEIVEVEAYRGFDDLACHASKGRSNRTEVMFASGGHVYIYLIYGLHWMLNVVTSVENIPQAILIRGVKGCVGPGRLTKFLGIDKSFYGEDLVTSERIWIEKGEKIAVYKTGPRIGVEYAGELWARKPWRYWIH
jgi:DNA-3-methyladenine glycosylase